nr:MAG TPA: hypothetical protein [Caudoviricetes sp.]
MKEDLQIKINIPEGYKIDKEKSTFETIIFKKIKLEVKVFEDIKHINGYYINTHSGIYEITQVNDDTNRNVFLTEKHAKSALAMAQISQLLPYYGGEITDEEWRDTRIPKYSLGLRRGETKWCYSIALIYAIKDFLCFHSKEEAQRFLDSNEDLVRDYYMIEESDVIDHYN